MKISSTLWCTLIDRRLAIFILYFFCSRFHRSADNKKTKYCKGDYVHGRVIVFAQLFAFI